MSLPDKPTSGGFCCALNELFGNLECDLFNEYIIPGCIWVQQALGPCAVFTALQK